MKKKSTKERVSSKNWWFVIIAVIVLVVILSYAFILNKPGENKLGDNNVFIPEQKETPIVNYNNNSGNSNSEYPSEQTFRNLFISYRQSISGGDFSAFKYYVSSDSVKIIRRENGGDLTEQKFRQVASALNAVYPPIEDVMLYGTISSGNVVTWYLKDNRNENNKGNITFVREGLWKVQKEQWEESS
ncbi:MAG: hypothetical protein Q7S74_02210 [Nanoarchaeota archaeon]|nr:hypothetical protein [Nanoarchaeota archaeon]